MANAWKITDIIVAIIFVYVIASMLAIITGCASQAKQRQMDSNHYKAQAQPQAAQVESETQNKPYQGPVVFGSGWYSDVKYRGVYNTTVKNTWKVSPDGSSGSMSSTRINIHENSTDGVQGSIVGPAGFWYRY